MVPVPSRTDGRRLSYGLLENRASSFIAFIIISINIIMLNLFCTTIFAKFSNRDLTVICLCSLFRQNFSISKVLPKLDGDPLIGFRLY
jgi:hypothetical protein